MARVVMRLEGEAGEMDARALRAGLDHFTRFLAALADEPSLPLPVVNLEMGSMAATVDAPEHLRKRMDEGLHQLSAAATRPAGWRLEALHELLNYAKLPGRHGLTGVAITGMRPTPIDDDLRRAIEKVLSNVPVSLGAIQGRLSTYFGVSRPVKIRIVPDGMRSYVGVTVPDRALAEEAARLVEQRVAVRGYIVRHPDTGEIEEMTARRIEKLEVPRERMTLKEAVGIWPPELFGGLDSVEIGRAMRDEA